MKRVDLPVSRLSLAQKLDLMETLWADLSRDEQKLESPAWHKAVLEDREEAFKSGKVNASDWEQVKKRIRKKSRTEQVDSSDISRYNYLCRRQQANV